jgi:hypothetical protein
MFDAPFNWDLFYCHAEYADKEFYRTGDEVIFCLFKPDGRAAMLFTVLRGFQKGKGKAVFHGMN